MTPPARNNHAATYTAAAPTRTTGSRSLSDIAPRRSSAAPRPMTPGVKMAVRPVGRSLMAAASGRLTSTVNAHAPSHTAGARFTRRIPSPSATSDPSALMKTAPRLRAESSEGLQGGRADSDGSSEDGTLHGLRRRRCRSVAGGARDRRRHVWRHLANATSLSPWAAKYSGPISSHDSGGPWYEHDRHERLLRGALERRANGPVLERM